MAQQPDIVGMFTGISSNKQPIVNDPTGAIGRIRQSQQNLRGAVTGMFGKETREVKQQRQVADLIGKFDGDSEYLNIKIGPTYISVDKELS